MIYTIVFIFTLNLKRDYLVYKYRDVRREKLYLWHKNDNTPWTYTGEVILFLRGGGGKIPERVKEFAKKHDMKIKHNFIVWKMVCKKDSLMGWSFHPCAEHVRSGIVLRIKGLSNLHYIKSHWVPCTDEVCFFPPNFMFFSFPEDIKLMAEKGVPLKDIYDLWKEEDDIVYIYPYRIVTIGDAIRDNFRKFMKKLKKEDKERELPPFPYCIEPHVGIETFENLLSGFKGYKRDFYYYLKNSIDENIQIEIKGVRDSICLDDMEEWRLIPDINGEEDIYFHPARFTCGRVDTLPRIIPAQEDRGFRDSSWVFIPLFYREIPNIAHNLDAGVYRSYRVSYTGLKKLPEGVRNRLIVYVKLIEDESYAGWSFHNPCTDIPYAEFRLIQDDMLAIRTYFYYVTVPMGKTGRSKTVFYPYYDKKALKGRYIKYVIYYVDGIDIEELRKRIEEGKISEYEKMKVLIKDREGIKCLSTAYIDEMKRRWKKDVILEAYQYLYPSFRRFILYKRFGNREDPAMIDSETWIGTRIMPDTL